MTQHSICNSLKHIAGIENINSSDSNLIILLGCLGDFDSFEYAFNVKQNIKKLNSMSVNVKLIAIGNEESKRRFSLFNDLPSHLITVVPDNSTADIPVLVEPAVYEISAFKPTSV